MPSSTEESDETVLAASGDLVMYAARLVRASRENIHHTPPAGVRILSLIDEHGPSGISQLAGWDRCSQPTMSGAITGLVERGWVTKRPDPADARASVIEMTDQGHHALRVVRRRNAQMVAAALAAHPSPSPEDLDTAVAVLRHVLEASSQEGHQ